MSDTKPPTTYCIHIFRRDYRLDDNTTLIEACKTHDIVIPMFIFTKTQINKSINSYRSDNCVQFLCESLEDLDKQLRNVSNKKGNINASQLYIHYTDDEYAFLKTIIDMMKTTNSSHTSHPSHNLKTISFNMDYTKYSKDRDLKIKTLCEANKINCLSLDDICVNPVGTILNGSGKPYTKFTPFWRASAKKYIRKPVHNTMTNYLEKNSSISSKLLNHKTSITIEDVMKPKGKYGIMPDTINEHLPEHGGRINGLAILNRLKEWKTYGEDRDMLSYKTTHLSPFNKFGCVSIREVYWAMKDKMSKVIKMSEVEDGIIRQLFWRDFFYNLSHYHPEIYTERALNPKYRNIKWSENAEGARNFARWCAGETGFPVVDACMREINTTGYMHNRGRLIVSNFLCRLLNIDWKKGERYFATKLYDYDPTQNNFGWQVSGSNSSGTTSRPLEQTIMNPWIQSLQFDKDGEYIKKWMPELASVNARDLHRWDTACDDYISGKKDVSGKDVSVKYIKPIIDYKTEKAKNLALYRKYL